MAKTTDEAMIKQIDAMLSGGGKAGVRKGVYAARPKDIVRLARKSKKRKGKLGALVNTGDALDKVPVGALTRARGIRIPDVKMHVNRAGQLAAAPSQGPAKPKRKKVRKSKAARKAARKVLTAKKPRARKSIRKTAKRKNTRVLYKTKASKKPAKRKVAKKGKRKARFAKGSAAALAWGKKMKAARAAKKGGKKARKPAKRRASKKARKSTLHGAWRKREAYQGTRTIGRS